MLWDIANTLFEFINVFFIFHFLTNNPIKWPEILLYSLGSIGLSVYFCPAGCHPQRPQERGWCPLGVWLPPLWWVLAKGAWEGLLGTYHVASPLPVRWALRSASVL